MLTIGNKEYSEKQAANSLLNLMIKRWEWCKEQARKYLRKKEHDTFYKLTISYYTEELDDFEEFDEWHPISDQIIDQIHQDMLSYTEENGDFANEDERKEWIKDYCLTYGGFWNIDACRGDYYGICDIDLDNKRHAYEFIGFHFNSSEEGTIPKRTCQYATLTDEEYVEIVARMIQESGYSFDDMRFMQEKLHKRLCAELYYKGFNSAIIATELENDAKIIIDSVGGQENIPEWFTQDNIFVPYIIEFIFENKEEFAEQIEKLDGVPF